MNNDRLANKIPLWLMTLVLLLLGLRIIVWSIERNQNQELAGIKWNEPSKIDLVGRNYQSKLILYYFSAEGYESCKVMNNTSLLNKDVVLLVNEDFLPVKIDCKEQSEGELSKLSGDLQQKHAVFTFPTLVVTLPSGAEVEKRSAYAGLSSRQLLRFLVNCQKREGYARGIDYLSQAKYGEAARSFETWLGSSDNFNKDTIDGALYCALAYEMIGQDKEARRVLELPLQNKRYSKDKKWPMPLAEFLLGELNPEDLIKESDRIGGKDPRADYFIGMLDLKSANLRGAVDNFKNASKSAYASSDVYSLIQGQLNMINQQRE